MSRFARKMHDARRFSRLGFGLTSRLRLLFVPFLALLPRWFPWSVEATVSLYGRTALVHIASASDCAALRDVFVDREYELDGSDPETILDIGSNIGMSVIFWRLRYPGARIVAVEPDPNAYARLTEAASRAGAQCYRYAVTDYDGTTTFYSHARNTVSSSLVSARRAGGTEVRVPARTLLSLLKESGIARADLLKFDVEGAEDRIFERVLPKDVCRRAVGEVHDDLMRTSRSDFLTRFGVACTCKPISASRCLLYASFPESV